ncbi:MAG: hypothetical protein Kow0074_22020 [Candidatus Zixiibacteriota bacterium]
MITLPVSDIIRDSFKLAWKYKYLWLFGLFAAGNTSFNLPLDGGDGGGIGQLEQAYEWLMAALVLLILIGLAIGLIVLILHVISKSALIYNVYQIETNGQHGLGAGWDFGLKRFWQMLGLTLLQIVCIAAFIIILAVFVGLFFAAATVLGVLSLLIAIPVGIAGVALILLIWTYAERFVTLETRGVVQSVGEAWDLLKSQWKPSLTMLLVKVAIAIAVGIGTMGVGAALAIPAIPMWFISPALAIVYGILIFLPFVVFVGAYFGTFDSAVWTKTFLLLRAPAYAAAPQPTTPPPPPHSSTGGADPDHPSPPLFE